MGWQEVDGKIISTRRELSENLKKECAMSEDRIGLMVCMLQRQSSAQRYVQAIRESNMEYCRWRDERDFEDFEEDDDEDDEEFSYTPIETVYVTSNGEVVAQNVKFIETYNVPVPEFIKNDIECRKQIKKTSKEYVIYDNVNNKKLFGDTLDECFEYAIKQVRYCKSKASMIHIINRRYSKCILVTVISTRIEGNIYKNIPNKQYVEDLYEFEYAGSVHI